MHSSGSALSRLSFTYSFSNCTREHELAVGFNVWWGDVETYLIRSGIWTPWFVLMPRVVVNWWNLRFEPSTLWHVPAVGVKGLTLCLEDEGYELLGVSNLILLNLVTFSACWISSDQKKRRKKLILTFNCGKEERMKLLYRQRKYKKWNRKNSKENKILWVFRIKSLRVLWSCEPHVVGLWPTSETRIQSQGHGFHGQWKIPKILCLVRDRRRGLVDTSLC